jgi:vitamin B12 transporter
MNTATRILLSGISAAVCAAPGFAQDTNQAFLDSLGTITVIGTRSPQKVIVETLPSPVAVIRAAELEAAQTRQISDILETIPGFSVTTSGPRGGQTQIRIRGTEANHALVLIDGIEASDPFQGEFDFSNLIADDAARVDVLKGQQSSLYGSDAIGGVISYRTLSGAERQGVSARIEVGSNNAIETAARVGGLIGTDVDYALNVVGSQSSGTNVSPFGSEDDGYRNRGASATINIQPAEWLKLSLVGRYTRAFGETDPQDFAFPSTPTQGLVIDGSGEYYRDQQRMGLLRVVAGGDASWLKGALTVQGIEVERRTFSNGLPSFFTDGGRFKVSGDVTLRLGEFGRGTHDFTLGADARRETYRNLPTSSFVSDINSLRVLETTGIVGEYLYTSGGFSASVAVRHDDNDRFQGATTGRVAASWGFGEYFRVRGAYGTGIKNPTNFELFGFSPNSFIGNPNLKPESSRGWEIGFDAADISLVGTTAEASVTFFSSVLEDEIFTAFLPGFISTPGNRTTGSEQQGVEIEGGVRLLDNLQVRANYTWLDATENAAREVRRPEHSGGVAATIDAPWGTQFIADARYSGEVEDNEFIFATPASRVTLDPVTRVNLLANHDFGDRFTVFARAENVFDERGEEVFGYRPAGRTFAIGVRATLQ